MRHTGKYSPVEDEFDLEQEIELAVDKAKKWIKSIENFTDNDKQKSAILKAIATTIVDAI